MTSEKYIGLDVHQATISVAVMDASGKLVPEARELAGRGFKFCGPTIVYAFMQAVGMVNDHLVKCHRHAACAKLGRHRR